jgi:hypothetical protein
MRCNDNALNALAFRSIPSAEEFGSKLWEARAFYAKMKAFAGACPAWPRVHKRHTMKNKASGVVAVLLFTLCISGCAYLRTGGPCYGFGCRESAPTQTAQSTAPVRRDLKNGKALAKNHATSQTVAQPGN